MNSRPTLVPVLVLAIGVWFLAADVVEAQRSFPAPLAPMEVIRFRRLYVPQESVPDLAQGLETIKREDFERHMQEASRAGTIGATPGGPRIAEAHYDAKLGSGAELVGTVRMRLEYDGREPALMPFEPCSLFLDRLEWEASQQPADLGLDRQNQVVLLVHQSGWLRGSWSRNLETRTRGDLGVALQLPGSPQNRLRLELPPHLEPQWPDAIVTRLDAPPGREAENSPPTAAPNVERDRPNDSGSRPGLWQIDFPAGSSHSLSITSARVYDSSEAGHFARLDHTYALDESGFTLETRVYFDALRQPLRRLTMEADGNLHVATARWSGRNLPFRQLSTDASTTTRVELDFPQPVSGAGHELVLQAIGRIELGKLWKLPDLRVLGPRWQQGRAQINVPSSLVVANLSVAGGHETQASPLPAPWEGTNYGVQYFDPTASVQVQLERRPKRLKVRTGFSIVVGSSTTHGTAVIDVGSRHGEHFAIQGLVAPGWTVDTVTTDPPAALDSWQLRASQLRLTLAEAISPARIVRVRIGMHRQTRDPADSRMFRLVRVQEADELERLVTVGAESPLQLRTYDDLDLYAARVEAFDEANTRISSLPGGLTYRDEDGLTPFKVGIRRDRPDFAAASTIDVQLGGGQMVTEFTVQCEPRGSAVGRMLVLFSRVVPEALTWVSANGGPELLNTRRLLPEERARRGFGDGDAWEITLRQSRRPPFQLRARTVTRLDSKVSVPLVSVPDAYQQQGVVQVHVKDGSRPAIQVSGMVPLTPPPQPAAEYPTLRGIFRYAPLEEAQLEIHPEEQRSCASVWVVQAHVVSQVEPDGRVTQTVIYRLENQGVPRFHLTLPDGGQLQRVLVNNEEVDRSRVVGQAELQVQLPQSVRFPRVQITYSLPGYRLGFVSDLTMPQPTLDIPTLDVLHDIWLPPGYRLMVSEHPQAGRDRDMRRRLFGEVLGDPRGKPFPITDPNAWDRWLGNRDERKYASIDVPRLLAAMTPEPIELSLARRPGVGWGTLLEAIRSGPAASSLDVLVDALALSELGLQPASVAFVPQSGDAFARAVETLRRGNVALLLTPGAICFTTRVSAQLHSAALEATDIPGVWIVRSETLAEEMRNAHGRPGLQYSALDSWTRGVNLGARWPASSSLATVDPPSNGWTGIRLRGEEARGADPARPLVHLRAMNTHALAAAGMAVYLFTVGICGLWRFRSPIYLVVLSALAVGLLVWIPESWVAPARGLAAALLTVFLRWVYLDWQSVSVVPGEGRSGVSRGSAVLARCGALWLMLLVGEAPALADPPVAEPPTSSALNVVIPVDDMQRPVGDYLYVPRVLYDAILQGRLGGRASRSWILRGAEYSGVLEIVESTGQVQLSQLEATYRVEVLTAGVPLEIPLGRPEDTLIAATLDGQPFLAEFDARTRQMVCRQVSAGPHDLTFTIRPANESTPVLGRCKLPIPRIPNAQLKLRVPRGLLNQVRVARQGALRATPIEELLQAELGGLESLDLEWPSQPQMTGEPDVIVDELLWLHVRPDELRLELKVVLSPVTQPIARLEVATDLGLKPLVPTDSGGPVLKRQTQLGDQQILEWEFEEPLTRTTTFSCSFAVQGTRGIGQIRLPQLQVRDARPARKWIAISKPADLTLQPSSNVELVASADFLKAWGNQLETPDLVFREPADDWTFLCRPLESKLSCDEQVEIYLSPTFADLRFTAALSRHGPTPLQYRLRGFRDLEVQAVRLISQTTVADLRWNKSGDELSLFLESTPEPVHELRIQARVQVTPGKEFPIPDARLLQVERTGREITVFRRFDCAFRWGTSPPGLVHQESRRSGTRNHFRLAGSWRQDGPSGPDVPPPTLVVSSNQPKVTGLLVAELQRADHRWWSQTTFDLNVASGILDALRVEIPEQFREPFEFQPAADYEVRRDPMSRLSEILIYPQRPLAGKQTLRLKAEVVPRSGERFNAPLPSTVDFELERRLVLPTQLETGPIAWETTGMREVAESTYQAIGQHPSALIGSIKSEAVSPRVPLAEARIAWSPDGIQYGTVTFFLEPARASHCILNVPAEVVLLDVSLEGLEARLEREGAHRYRVFLANATLPQRLSVRFQSRHASDSAAATLGPLPLPTLAGIQVERTLGMIRVPATVDLDAAPELGVPVTATRQLAVQFVTLRRLIAQSDELAPESDLQAWRSSWLQRLAALKSSARQIRETRPELASEELDAILEYSLPPDAPAPGAPDDGALPLFDGGRTIHTELEGPLSALVLSAPRPYAIPASQGAEQAILAAALVALVCGSVVFGPLADWLRGWPVGVAVLVAIGWWLFLQPSIAGVVAVAAILAWLLLRGSWAAVLHLRRLTGATASSTGESVTV